MNLYLEVLKKYAVFSGRARRSEYWSFQLFNFVIGFFLMIISLAINSPVLIILFLLAVILPGIAVTIRRLHDTGKSGWWLFITFVPYIGGLILFIFMCTDSQKESNKYGECQKKILIDKIKKFIKKEK